MFEITKDVPHQPPTTKRVAKYPFGKLQIGESFLVPGHTSSLIASVRAGATHAQKRFSISLSTRVMPDGLRIWRTA